MKNMEKGNLTQMRVVKNDINKNNDIFSKIDNYCWLSKNLYNRCNYLIRQLYITTRKLHNKEDITKEQKTFVDNIHKWVNDYNIKVENGQTKGKKKMKLSQQWYGEYFEKETLNKYILNEIDYKSLQSQSAQSILKRVDSTWTSYFNSLTDYYKNPNKYKGKPRMPNYKDSKNGRYMFILTNIQVKIINNTLFFTPKDLKKYTFQVPLADYERRHSKDCDLKEVRFVPNNDIYTMEIVYKIKDKPKIKEKKGKMIGIDIGVDRLATVCNSIGVKPFAINGKLLKSINKFWNKQIADYKSKLKKVNNKYSSKKYLKMCRNRNNKMSTYMHQSASYIIKWCVQHDIDTIVIGKNDGWKQKCNVGKETQTFVQIPFANFIEKIKYRAEALGIEVILQEESYTSKSSFIDEDYIPTFKKDDNKANFSGSRKLRGLYITKDGIKIHADLNGAYNILRKYDSSFTYNNDYLHPYIITPNN